MASINTLPIELLHKIVDLTVEDAIALKGGGEEHKQEKLRRNILIRLALVSKDFTRPAQLALWRYMSLLDDVGEVEDLIEAGFGKDKVVEELEIWINFKARDGNESFTQLISFLRGVKKVISITQLMLFGAALPLDELFEIDSIQALKSMVIYHYGLTEISVSPQTRLPSHLRHLNIAGLSKEMDGILSLLIKSSSSTLTSIELISITLNEYSGSTLSSVLSSLGPRLRKLEVDECDKFIVSSLLPCCTSLKSLIIHPDAAFSEEEFKLDIETLGTIPQSVILESFSIAFPHSSNLVHFPSFLQLLQTSPFTSLKILNLCSIDSGRVGSQKFIGVVKGNDDFMEIVKNKGIILGFGTEEQVRLNAEKEKQRLYRERQKNLESALYWKESSIE